MSPAVTHKEYALPMTVVSRVDLSRLVGELEWVDNELTAYTVRAKSGATVSVPTLSAALNDFLVMNGLQLNESRTRSSIIAQLRVLKNKAPVFHMTFAVSADRESLQTIADWLRKEIHPQALIDVGVQPAIVGGVYLRTPNHVHDFSMRTRLAGKHDLLTKSLEVLRGAK